MGGNNTYLYLGTTTGPVLARPSYIVVYRSEDSSAHKIRDTGGKHCDIMPARLVDVRVS